MLRLTTASIFLLLLLTNNSAQALPHNIKPDDLETITPTSCFEMLQETGSRGACRIYVSPMAVRADQITFNFTLVSKAPKWDVFIYRQSKRQVSQLTYKEWCHSDIWRLSEQGKYGKIALQHQTRSRGGQKFVVYDMVPVTEFKNSLLYRTQDRPSSEEVIPQVTCLTYDGDIHAGSIIGHLSSLPELKGIPTTALLLGKKNRYWTMRSTRIKVVPKFSPAFFDVPADCKKIVFDKNFVTTDEQKGAMMDFLN